MVNGAATLLKVLCKVPTSDVSVLPTPAFFYGLKPGEVDYIYAGATAARFAALASGSIAATIMTPPFNFKAAGQGFNSLGVSADYTKNFPFSGYSLNTRWASAAASGQRSKMPPILSAVRSPPAVSRVGFVAGTVLGTVR